jgi:hypothetical protein
LRYLHSFNQLSEYFIKHLIQARSQGEGARAAPFREKCLEGDTGLNNYSQGPRFSPLAGSPPPLRKFLATLLIRCKVREVLHHLVGCLLETEDFFPFIPLFSFVTRTRTWPLFRGSARPDSLKQTLFQENLEITLVVTNIFESK